MPGSLTPGEIPQVQVLQVLQQGLYSGKFTDAQITSIGLHPNLRMLLPAIGKCAAFYEKKDINQNKLCLAMMLCHKVTQEWASCIKSSDEVGKRCLWEKQLVMLALPFNT